MLWTSCKIISLTDMKDDFYYRGHIGCLMLWTSCKIISLTGRKDDFYYRCHIG